MKNGLKKFISQLLCASFLLGASAMTLSSCGGKDELGNKYMDVIEDKAAAIELVGSGKAESDLISDIEYEIALMVHSEYGEESYDLGIKNAFSATGRNTDDTEVFCSKTYYGTQGNETSIYYRYDGHLYFDYCNTLMRTAMSEQEFYSYLSTTARTADTDFFKTAGFSEGRIYEYSNGTRAAVFTQPTEELKEKIAVFLGLSGGSYVYNFSDVFLRFDVTKGGSILKCTLDFNIDYHETLSPQNVVTYDGNFGCIVTATGNGVNVRTPQNGVEYTTVSDFKKLQLIFDGYKNLAALKDLSFKHYRKIRNEDVSGKLYSLETEANFTQTYRDEVYNYGSIDVEKGSTPKGDTVSSVGVFVGSDGKYHYRDIENRDHSDDNPMSVDEWFGGFAATVTEELFFEEDITKITVTEEGDIITFTYEYSDDSLESYATYLLDAFSEEQGNLSISGQRITTQRNKGTVKVRMSDGCLIYHSVEFEALIGYSVKVSGDYVLTVTATGDDVEVLDLDDWAKHEMRFN